MFDYADLAASATDLVEEFGAPIVLERSIGAEYDASTSEVIDSRRKVTGTAVREEYELRDIDGDSIRFGDVKLIVSTRAADGTAMPEPRTDERVLFDTTWWTVIRSAPIKHATVAVAYQVQARR